MYTCDIDYCTKLYTKFARIFAKIRLISSNIRQKLGKIDNTAVHRICCSMTNTYNTYLDHINCYGYILSQYLHIFHFSPGSIFNGGRLEHMNFYIPGCPWGD